MTLTQPQTLKSRLKILFFGSTDAILASQARFDACEPENTYQSHYASFNT